MNKRAAVLGLATLVCIAGILAWQLFQTPTGGTAESRQAILNTALADGQGWTIASETELDGFVISAAYSANGKTALAVFKPAAGGRFTLSTSATRAGGGALISGAMIHNTWYDLIWLSDAQAEHAEVYYTVNGQAQDPLLYDVKDGKILCIENQEKDYSISVSYTAGSGKAARTLQV